MKTTMTAMKVALLAVLALCSGLKAEAQNNTDKVRRQEHFSSINKLLEFYNSRDKGSFHDPVVFACATNRVEGKPMSPAEEEMCLSGSPMSVDEAVNFFNRLPKNRAEAEEKGLLHMLKYCGGCYLVWTERVPRAVAVAPPAPAVPQYTEQLEQPEPAPAPAVSKTFAPSLSITIGDIGFGGGGEYIDEGWRNYNSYQARYRRPPVSRDFYVKNCRPHYQSYCKTRAPHVPRYTGNGPVQHHPVGQRPLPRPRVEPAPRARQSQEVYVRQGDVRTNVENRIKIVKHDGPDPSRTSSRTPRTDTREVAQRTERTARPENDRSIKRVSSGSRERSSSSSSQRGRSRRDS